MTPPRLVAAVVAALVITAAGCVVALSDAATSAPADGASPGALARRLAAAPAVDFSDPARVANRDLRTVADGLASAAPLPAGGTFNGIQWEQLGERFPKVAVVQMLEYNATCQWLRARRDGRERDAADEVLATVPSWPAFRQTETGPVLADAVRGGELLDGVLADCDAAHRREVVYANDRGLRPST